MTLRQIDEHYLPATLDDLAKFVLVGRDKLSMVRAGIRALDKLDVAEGVRQQKKEEAQMLAEALLDAEAKIGELLKQMPKAQGGDRKSENFKSNSAVTFDRQIETKESAAARLGFDKMQVSRFQILADNRELIEQVKAEARENDDLPTRTEVLRRIQEQQRVERENKREERREENWQKIEAVEDPLKAGARFATIVLDPPWDWGDEGDVNQFGRARPDYGTMSFEQLIELPVPALSDDDCHIYMWITNRSLPKGFALLDSWGFRYVTMLTWPKPSFGMGNYFRGQTEHVLFGVKGSQMLARRDASTLLPTWRRGPNGHSSKPLEFYDFVESCSPGPFLELFSRNKREGWKTWGADA